MPKPIIKVGVNGFGVIGKRVADAVSMQRDMKLIGISDVASDWRIKLAAGKHPIYASTDEAYESMKSSGIEVSGNLRDLLSQVDVIVDCTPAGIGAKNKAVYDELNVKSIFQGGEKHELTGVSFVATCNYDESLGKQSTRVVSCNTTALCRVLIGLLREFGVREARVVIVRRACDVWESHKAGIINTVTPELKIPSHHGPDVKKVIKDLNIVTLAAKGSHNLYHIHFAFIKLSERASREDVLRVLEEEPRVVLIDGSDGIAGLNSIFELARDLNRPRGDLYEIPVWSESVKVSGEELTLIWATPNESNVIPENIDAIRALTESESDWRKSVELTDKSLGVLSKLY